MWGSTTTDYYLPNVQQALELAFNATRMAGRDQMLDGEELALAVGDALVALERGEEDGAEGALADPMVQVEDGGHVGDLLLQLGDLPCERVHHRKIVERKG